MNSQAVYLACLRQRTIHLPVILFVVLVIAPNKYLREIHDIESYDEQDTPHREVSPLPLLDRTNS